MHLRRLSDDLSMCILFLTLPCIKVWDSLFAEHCGLTVVIPTYMFSTSVNSRVPHGTSCPPLITYVNSTDAPCIHSPKARGLTALYINYVFTLVGTERVELSSLVYLATIGYLFPIRILYTL